MYKLLNGIAFYSAEEIDEQFSNEGAVTERERAEAAEAQLQTNIETETTRATTAEQTNATTIANETTRAETAEQVLDSRMTNLETSLNQTNENLASEVTRATTAEQTNADAISAEATRATTAEQTNADAISAEALRAQETERNINNALLSESERAQRVESQTDTALSTEVTRATAAEQANADAIEAEVTRATAAEQANADAIEAEVTRATAAEQALDQKVADEELRASTAEATLTTSITGLSTRITKLNTEVDTNGSHQIMTFNADTDLPTINFDSATQLKIYNGQLAFVKGTQAWYKATTTDTEGNAVTWTEYIMPTTATTDNLNDYPYVVNPKPGQFRWLRFDTNNKNGLIIQKGVTINLSYFGVDKLLRITKDTPFDMGNDLSVGTNYNAILTYTEVDGLQLTAKTIADTGPSDVVIGWFSTLCGDVGNTYCRVRFPNSMPVTAGVTKYLIQKYDKNTDPDFYAFYNKTVISDKYDFNGAKDIYVGMQYTTADVEHPLNGYEAGNILPESIWCDTWHPAALRPTTDRPDSMVYCANSGTAIDVYLQSGTGTQTKSAYIGAIITQRVPKLHIMDMAAVGKKLLSSYEFSCAAIGSNECTILKGTFDNTTNSGDHRDTANRHMLSAIGCEDMCGLVWQYLDEIGPASNPYPITEPDPDPWYTADEDGQFGGDMHLPYMLTAGGSTTSKGHSGSFSRATLFVYDSQEPDVSARGSSYVIRGRS